MNMPESSGSGSVRICGAMDRRPVLRTLRGLPQDLQSLRQYGEGTAYGLFWPGK